MQTLSLDQLVGRTLRDYQIERLLGYSRLGAAYMARQLSQGRTVMITLFNFPRAMSDEEDDQCALHLAQERVTLIGLAHPNILPIYDFGLLPSCLSEARGAGIVGETDRCREQPGYLYLVTAFVKGASLAQVMQQQGRLTLQQTLDVVKQLAAGLDHARSKGAVHGILNLSNVFLSNERTVQIAGFGLRTMLEVYGQRQDTQLQSYLFSTSGAFLGSPEGISPERLLGKPVGFGSDIYALGVMLFELVTGTAPFSGANPLDIALKRIQQPVPSVHTLCPDLPQGLDLVIAKMLERDPAQRYQRAGDSVLAFERVLTMLQAMQPTAASSPRHLAQEQQLTLPPTINWFEEENRVPSQEALPPSAGSRPDSLAGIDPFAWWSATSSSSGKLPAATGMVTRRSSPSSTRQARSNPRSRPAQQDRRKFVKLMAVGTVGVLTVSGISFAHFIQSLKQPQSQVADIPTAGSTAPTARRGNTPTVEQTRATQKTPTPARSPTAKPSPSATKAPQPSPTAQPTRPPQPTPTPTPPSHTGMVIGYTSQQINSSKNFQNPADGQGSLLIHLSNSNFVACERSCTHAGVAVNYDPGSGQLVCPAHGAVFDPLHGFSHVSGPGNGPLATVTIRVNGDGTITTG